MDRLFRSESRRGAGNPPHLWRARPLKEKIPRIGDTEVIELKPRTEILDIDAEIKRRAQGKDDTPGEDIAQLAVQPESHTRPPSPVAKSDPALKAAKRQAALARKATRCAEERRAIGDVEASTGAETPIKAATPVKAARLLQAETHAKSETVSKDEVPSRVRTPARAMPAPQMQSTPQSAKRERTPSPTLPRRRPTAVAVPSPVVKRSSNLSLWTGRAPSRSDPSVASVVVIPSLAVTSAISDGLDPPSLGASRSGAFHIRHNRRPPPSASASSQQVLPDSTAFDAWRAEKAATCEDWVTKQCPLTEDTCRRRHAFVKDIRHGLAPHQITCYHWKYVGCRNGTRCRFAHSADSVEAFPNEWMNDRALEKFWLDMQARSTT